MKVKRFSYYEYANNVRDKNVINDHLRLFAGYFENCNNVLDIGCGEGIFMNILKERGVQSEGIEYDAEIAKDVRSMGFKVYEGSCTDIWGSIHQSFDGAFCSHLIEHLPFEFVVDFIEGLSTKLNKGAIVVFAWPNPESIQMQLFHFWRDPEHVRFYDRHLISALFEHYGIKVNSVYSQGSWGEDVDNTFKYGEKSSSVNSVNSKHNTVSRKFIDWIKVKTGIKKLQVESNYIEFMRRQGRELVIVGEKI